MANNQNTPGAFLPTTAAWDVAQVYQTDVNAPEFKELLVRLYQNMNNMALVLNMKETGFYTIDNEFICGQNWFPNPSLNSSTTTTATYRQAIRKVINFGTLPNNTTKSVPHNIVITPTVTFTRIYGAGSNPSTQFIPLPYVTSGNTDGIQLDITATDVVMTTTGNYSSYTTSYVIVEYLKQ